MPFLLVTAPSGALWEGSVLECKDAGHPHEHMCCISCVLVEREVSRLGPVYKSKPGGLTPEVIFAHSLSCVYMPVCLNDTRILQSSEKVTVKNWAMTLHPWVVMIKVLV